ncbi:MAG: hypothetical protein GOV15_00315, partial [Candidatus Diapherotrites archaeon]|nr:hypothetical protein [Candidatus Diapherotrites archaeon]
MPIKKPDPKFKDLPILDAYDSVEIRKAFPVNHYLFKGPDLSPRDEEIVKVLSSLLLRKTSSENAKFSQITQKEAQDLLSMVRG